MPAANRIYDVLVVLLDLPTGMNFLHHGLPVGIHPMHAPDADILMREVSEHFLEDIMLFRIKRLIATYQQSGNRNEPQPRPVVKGNLTVCSRRQCIGCLFGNRRHLIRDSDDGIDVILARKFDILLNLARVDLGRTYLRFNQSSPLGTARIEYQ